MDFNGIRKGEMSNVQIKVIYWEKKPPERIASRRFAWSM